MQPAGFRFTRLNVVFHQNKRAGKIQRTRFPCNRLIILADTISNHFAVSHASDCLLTFKGNGEIYRFKWRLTTKRTPRRRGFGDMDPAMPHPATANHILPGGFPPDMREDLFLIIELTSPVIRRDRPDNFNFSFLGSRGVLL